MALMSGKSSSIYSPALMSPWTDFMTEETFWMAMAVLICLLPSSIVSLDRLYDRGDILIGYGTHVW